MSISEFIDSVRPQVQKLEKMEELMELADNEDEQAMFELGLIYEELLSIAEMSDNVIVNLCDDLRDSMEDFMYNSAELGCIDAQEWVNDYRDDDDGRWDAYV